MWKLCFAALLATATMAQAQQVPSKTIKFFNNQTKEQIGTATVYGNTVYLRDRHGVHYATIVREPNGTQTLYDPHGLIIEKGSLALPNLSE